MNTNFAQVRMDIEKVATSVGRDPRSINIVGVSKEQPPDKIVSAFMEGLRDIGENRYQEASVKIPLVKDMLRKKDYNPDEIRWHMVGHIQSNKAGKVAELFNVVQSVDRYKVAVILSRRAVDIGKTLEILIEVNTSGEESKEGVQPVELFDLVKELNVLPGIKLNGLMTVGPLTDDVERLKASFDLLRNLRSEIGLKSQLNAQNWELSMGMTADYNIAITAGSTMVRIGTAIFGVRPSCRVT